jgi:hypothetical protein
MDNLWDSRWPMKALLSWNLKSDYHARWVRFHSLPESKRYADTPEESDGIVRRHSTVLSELQSASNGGRFIVIATERDWRTSGAGWTRQVLPNSWPWRAWVRRDDGYLHRDYFWVSESMSLSDLRPALLAVAEERGSIVIADEAMDWLYYPYDGGADVIARSPEEADALAVRHSEWLSQRDDGL